MSLSHGDSGPNTSSDTLQELRAMLVNRGDGRELASDDDRAMIGVIDAELRRQEAEPDPYWVGYERGLDAARRAVEDGRPIPTIGDYE